MIDTITKKIGRKPDFCTIKTITKRDGRKTEFNRDKVAQAIFKAALTMGGDDV